MWILPRQLLTAWNGSSDTEATISDLNELSQACAQSLLVRSKVTPLRTWLRKWKPDCWTRFLSGRIVRASRFTHFEEWLTSSLLPTHARDSVRRVNAKELAILGSYGLGLSEQLSFFAPDVFFSRTSLATSRLDSPQSSAIWKQRATKLRQEYLARVKSARLMRERGSSLWPTIKASEGSKRPNDKNRESPCLSWVVENWPTPNVPNGGRKLDSETVAAKGRKVDGTKAQVGLGDAVKLWMTPEALNQNGYQVSNGKKYPRLGQQVQNWPTPNTMPSRGSDGKAQNLQLAAQAWVTPQERTGAGVKNLNEQVAWATPRATDVAGEVNSWPSPAAMDWKENGTELAAQNRNSPCLPAAVVLAGPQDPENHSTNGKRPGQLNPDWVEQLQGIPTGWTDCDCAEMAWCQQPPSLPTELSQPA